MQGIFWSSPGDAEALGDMKTPGVECDGLSRATWGHLKEMPTYTRKTGKLEKVGALGTEGWLELAGEKRCWGCEEDRGCKDTCSTKEIYMCKVPGRIKTHLWRMKSSPWLQSSVGIICGERRTWRRGWSICWCTAGRVVYSVGCEDRGEPPGHPAIQNPGPTSRDSSRAKTS